MESEEQAALVKEARRRIGSRFTIDQLEVPFKLLGSDFGNPKVREARVLLNVESTTRHSNELLISTLPFHCQKLTLH